MPGPAGPAWAAAPGLPSIRLVVPFFGQPPPHLPLVLRSMGANPDVSWLLMTDQRVTGAPPNVTVQMWPFQDLRNRIRDFFDFEVSLKDPYKLCDFRPAFGAIFAEELAGFDFWGHCDLDLVFGRIRDHLPAVAFEADKVLFNGNFSLYRNTEQTAAWYRHEVGKVKHRDALSNPAAMHFDEWAGIYYIVEDLGAGSWTRTSSSTSPSTGTASGQSRPRAEGSLGTPGRTGTCASTGCHGVAWCAAPRC